jgi:hypothetical protein
MARERLNMRRQKGEFWLLYWVEVPLVIDNEVATAINEFEDAVWKYQKSEEEIRNYGMKLANSCRKSLGFVDEGLLRKMRTIS